MNSPNGLQGQGKGAVFRWLFVSLAIPLLAVAAWGVFRSTPEPATLTNGAALKWVDCWFDVSWWRPVYCGRFSTRPEGGRAATFQLPVVYVPARPWRASGTPLLYIAGGPGGAAMLGADDVGEWLEWLDEVGWANDVVFYDQRGVGLSQPLLDCPELLTARRALLPKNIAAEDLGQRLRAEGEACKRRLEADGHDFAVFTTPANAVDAADLMRAINPRKQWDLYGISYGTRVALELMRRESERLHAVVLDSVYPPDIHFELADPWLLERLFGLLGRVCELIGGCDYSPAEIAQFLRQALAVLQEKPLRIKAQDPYTGSEMDVVYRAEDFAWLLFEAAYRWDRLADLPQLIVEVAGGKRPLALRELVQDSLATQLDPSFSDAIASAVDCNDAYDLGADEMAEMSERFERVANLVEHDWEYHYCRFWKATDSGIAFRQAVKSAVPTLILAGEFDPVTPPHWAEETVEQLENAVLFEFPGIGHGALDSHACALELVNAFLKAPQFGPTPECVNAL